MIHPQRSRDIATLEILEESLLEYAGALVLVTHDRCCWIVPTIVLGLDGLGNSETFADYSQWEQWQREQGSANSDGSFADATVNARGFRSERNAEYRQEEALVPGRRARVCVD